MSKIQQIPLKIQHFQKKETLSLNQKKSFFILQSKKSLLLLFSITKY